MKSIFAGMSAGGVSHGNQPDPYRAAREHGLGVAADPDRQMRFLHRFRFESDVLERDVFSVEFRRIARPQLDDGGKVLVGHASALVERHAENLEFFCVPDDTEGDGNATVAHPVGCRQRLGQDDRMLQRQQRHGGHHPNSLCGTGNERLCDGRMKVVWSGQLHMCVGYDEVFRDRNHVVTQFLGAPGHRDLVWAGHIDLERLRQGLHPNGVRHSKAKLHGAPCLSVSRIVPAESADRPSCGGCVRPRPSSGWCRRTSHRRSGSTTLTS